MNTKDIKWVKLTVKTDLEFFTEWLKIIKSFSPLTDKEAEFMAILLTQRHELSKVILDEKILTKMLFDKEVKNYIVSELKMKDTQSVENMIYTLKKKNVIYILLLHLVADILIANKQKKKEIIFLNLD